MTHLLTFAALLALLLLAIAFLVRFCIALQHDKLIRWRAALVQPWEQAALTPPALHPSRHRFRIRLQKPRSGRSSRP
jgi:hypothetical protein